MPVAIRRTPFTQGLNVKISKSQARILAILLPDDESEPVSEWPIWTRAMLRKKVGFSEKNTLNRPINGDSTNKEHLGLLPMGLISEFKMDIDGLIETSYHITPRGIEVYRTYEETKGKPGGAKEDDR